MQIYSPHTDLQSVVAYRMEDLEVEVIKHIEGVSSSISMLYKAQWHSSEFLQNILYLLFLTVLPNFS